MNNFLLFLCTYTAVVILQNKHNSDMYTHRHCLMVLCI